MNIHAKEDDRLFLVVFSHHKLIEFIKESPRTFVLVPESNQEASAHLDSARTRKFVDFICSTDCQK